MSDLRERLSHVFWIGGGTDSGKTSIAGALAEKHRWSLYHYDRLDQRHHERLAAISADYAAFLRTTMDERWVRPTPEELAERSLRSFRDRFPMVIEDLTTLHLPKDMPILAEGFGLTPALVAPLLTHRRQAVWLLPSDGFKHASMQHRRKGEFGGEVSDPQRAADNLLRRDRLLADRVRDEAEARDLAMIEVTGSDSVNILADRISRHFTDS